MKEYRRFVAYVYEYQKEKKGRNCGFIQVEAKEQNCRMEVHLLCPGLLPEEKCEIFGFVRNSGLMDGILVGECKTGESRADCVVETDRESLGGSGIPLEKMGGMILLTESGGFFGTEWDDRAIRPDNFRRVKLQKEKEEGRKKLEMQEEVPEEDRKEPEMQKEIPEESRKKPEMQEEIPEESRKEPEMQEGEAVKAPEASEKVTEEAAEASEFQEKKAETEPKGVEPSGQKESSREQMAAQSVAEADVKKRKVEFPHIGEPAEIFEDGEIFDCRKIQLRDLCRLRSRECGLRNNRFLQYGFYNFGHLLLGRNRSGHYILGVPGAYDQQEQFMANMFGFPYFRESQQIQVPKRRGGYWYRLINPPEFH